MMSGGGELASANGGGGGAAVCSQCGTAFHKSSAKFCSRCGASREPQRSSADASRRSRQKKDDAGRPHSGSGDSTSTPTMPPLFPSTKTDGALEGDGKSTLRPFEVAQMQQARQQKHEKKKLSLNADAAAVLPLEFRDPGAVTSITSPKRATPAPAAEAAPPPSLTATGGAAAATLSSSPSSPTDAAATAAARKGRHKSGIYAKDHTLPELPPALLADPRRHTRNLSESSEEPETRATTAALAVIDGKDGANERGARTHAPVPPRDQPPSPGGRPLSASLQSAHGRRHSSRPRAQESAVEDGAAFADGTAGREGGEEASGSLRPSAEEEAQYTAWATLPPDGLTPEMLQTSNASELRKWRKGSLIGRGTYGSVYLGLLPDGSFFAVKSVELGNKRAADHLNILELVSLSREINMMHRLRHRNLCTFKGVYYDAENSAICMFMEYIGGGSLSSLVKRFKPLPPSVVRSWTTQLLSGLHYLHTQHIIHRDVKGDNVLVDTSADPSAGSQIKLVDFGAARRLTDAVSQSSTVIGTPYWMAPEVVDASGDGAGYSYKADVWSVGCTVAEMLTGRPPWPSKTSAPAAIMMIASATGMPTEIPEAEATPGCLDFMRKCFIRDPAKRPTVQALLQHPWIQGEME